jgi:drug/metabolite transporter (DMT)-like permease
MKLPHLLFVAMCLIWGMTWIAIKAGVEAVPPVFFAGSRFVAAGLFMLAWLHLRGKAPKLPRRDWPRLCLAAALMVTAIYALLFWGMQYVASGLAAVINLSLLPIGLLVIGLAYGEERYSHRRLAALGLGVSGLVVLFQPAAAGRGGALEPLGMAAIAAGTLALCWGSVLSRALVKAHGPLRISGLATLIGGLMLLGLAVLVEPVGAGVLAPYARPEVLASWLFLVFFGSLAAFTIYLRLLRDWGPSRAGMYAFVSPVVALALGGLVYGERLDPVQAIGAALMLCAAWLALWPGAPAIRRSGCAAAPPRDCR